MQEKAGFRALAMFCLSRTGHSASSKGINKLGSLLGVRLWGFEERHIRGNGWTFSASLKRPYVPDRAVIV